MGLGKRVHNTGVFVDDGVTGAIPLGERPAGSRLIETVKRTPETQFVISWEYSRWGRDADPEQIYFWELLLNRHYVKLISLDNPELTFKTAMERGIMRFVQRQASSQENKSKSLRSYSGGKRNIELGYLNTNTPPLALSGCARWNPKCQRPHCRTEDCENHTRQRPRRENCRLT
jgi:DNA invertase Pin-like site-specific DNA recombinase